MVVEAKKRSFRNLFRKRHVAKIDTSHTSKMPGSKSESMWIPKWMKKFNKGSTIAPTNSVVNESTLELNDKPTYEISPFISKKLRPLPVNQCSDIRQLRKELNMDNFNSSVEIGAALQRGQFVKTMIAAYEKQFDLNKNSIDDWKHARTSNPDLTRICKTLDRRSKLLNTDYSTMKRKSVSYESYIDSLDTSPFFSPDEPFSRSDLPITKHNMLLSKKCKDGEVKSEEKCAVGKEIEKEQDKIEIRKKHQKKKVLEEKKRKTKPEVVGAFLKKPIKIGDKEIRWVPISEGKKVRRRSSFLKLLARLTGSKVKKSDGRYSSFHPEQNPSDVFHKIMNLQAVPEEITRSAGLPLGSFYSTCPTKIVELLDKQVTADNNSLYNHPYIRPTHSTIDASTRTSLNLAPSLPNRLYPKPYEVEFQTSTTSRQITWQNNCLNSKPEVIYDVPRKLFAPGRCKSACDEPIYDVPKAIMQPRPKSSTYEDVLSRQRRNQLDSC